MDKAPFPILEFDPAREALIEPARLIKPRDVPQHCVICFFQEVIEKVGADPQAKVVVRSRWEDGPHPIYEIAHNDQRLAFYHPGVGGALAAGLLDEAIASHRRAVELSRGAPMMLGWLGLPLARSGKVAEAQALLDRLQAIAAKAYVPPTAFAWIYLGLGRTDQAFEWLDRAVDGRDHMLTPIKSYPFFDPIRSDPRYLALLRRMKLEP